MTAKPRIQQKYPLQKFATFFKGYGVALSLITAALPVGIAISDVFPFFTSIKASITAATSIGAYLLVGFIFSRRHSIARIYFPGRSGTTTGYLKDVRFSRLFGLLSASLALLSIVFFLSYLSLVDKSVNDAAFDHAFQTAPGTSERIPIRAAINNQILEIVKMRKQKRKQKQEQEQEQELEQNPIGALVTLRGQLVAYGIDKPIWITYRAQEGLGLPTVRSYSVQFTDKDTPQELRERLPSTSVPNVGLMAFYFLSAFLCCTSAFILMGLKEYLQEGLGLSDNQLIFRPMGGTEKRRFDIEHAAGFYGFVEFSPLDASLEPRIQGPLCALHDKPPLPLDVDQDGRVISWQHRNEADYKKSLEPCQLKGGITVSELEGLRDKSAMKTVRDYRQTFGEAQENSTPEASVLEGHG